MPKKAISTVYGADGRNHTRKRSGGTTPIASPKGKEVGNLKRNTSHVVLPKNRSHGNLRKNHSAKALTGLNRNRSLGALDKLGAPADQKTKQDESKQGVFDLAGSASEDEEDAEWEDSTASPEMTRNNSKVSTPVRVHTPNGEHIQKPPDAQHVVPERTSSPPEPSNLKLNKSAPDLRPYQTLAGRPIHDPSLLHTNGRASKAPPAMTTAIARAEVPRNESQRSLFRSNDTPQSTTTPALGHSTPSSTGVSHFLTSATDPTLPRTAGERNQDEDDSDSDTPSVRDFMSTYRPQPQLSESPETSRHTYNKDRMPNLHSRTQQRLALERQAAMHGNALPTPTTAGLALSAGSSASLHSRSASKSRNRGSLPVEYKYVQQDYEMATRQLIVVRRFRNPVLESLGRLRHTEKFASIERANNNNTNTTTTRANSQKKRPPSRHGRAVSATGQESEAGPATTNGIVNEHAEPTPSSEDHLHLHHNNPKSTHVSFQTNPQPHPRHAVAGRVSFQLSRQPSTDDITNTDNNDNNTVSTTSTSQKEPEMTPEEKARQLRILAEEALIRRIWESRVHVGVA